MQGKLQVLTALIKLSDRPFRPPHVVDLTGLDRQLVRYHIDKFRSQGLLEKIEKTYVVKDREGLLNSLVEANDRVETALPKPAGLFTTLQGVNAEAETLIAAKTLGLPMVSEARESLIKDIDASINVLKQLKKYLNNATKTTGSAQKFFNGKGGTDPEYVEKLWKQLWNRSTFTVDIAEFERVYEQAMKVEE
jgi:hypothetical protein